MTGADGFALTGAGAGDALGAALCCTVGDLSGDGKSDIAVGAGLLGIALLATLFLRLVRSPVHR